MLFSGVKGLFILPFPGDEARVVLSVDFVPT